MIGKKEYRAMFIGLIVFGLLTLAAYIWAIISIVKISL